MSGIYIHIPFCKQACYYCDFHFSTSLKKKDIMIEAIVKELKMRKSEIDEPVETIYFGGGTPSLLNTSEINGLIQTLADNYKLIDDPEVTLEANPDDLSIDKIKELAQSKVNRLSIGIQSFFDEDLKYMNRAHNAKEAMNSLEDARRYFDNISIDLIYGTPGLSDKKWTENLKRTSHFGIKHVSSYALTVEPKTALDHFIRSGKYQPLDEVLAQRHFGLLQQWAMNEGLVQYEVSNFGKKNYFSKHNTSYWKGKNYVGVGPAAHSYDGNYRSWNIANNATYMSSLKKGVLPSEVERLEVEDRINESIMTGLRTIWGVSINEIENRFGMKYREEVLKNADKYLKQGTLKVEKEYLILDPDSYFLADGISADLFLLKV
ncbi:radical SAM family heme chaperone HemW [Lutimonas sp.]|uniref:radical SAM family heme chaperone HemW n=1 Tax=Lutimonas sp. TaxID=1872403 RepID=UPI003D9BE333